MIIDKWNPKTKEYEELEIPEGNYPAISDDMDELITCPSCGKTFRFDEGYTSHQYFYKGGAFGMYVCPECYEKETE